jgi:AcrR family transcriptional regulator
MQKIGKEASVSTSNIYNYFKSKKHLFEHIVTPVAGEIDWTIQSIITKEEQMEGGFSLLLELIVQFLKKILREKHREIVLLFDYSKGTIFSSYRDKLISLLEDHFIEGLSGSDKKEQMRLTFHIVANNLVEGIIEIAKHYQDENQIGNTIEQFLTYHLEGMKPFYQE